MARRPRKLPKQEPFAWRRSDGLFTQPMLREYIRWLFPQLGLAYQPPQGVKDYSAAAVSTTKTKQPEPFRPRAASGPVLKSDLQKFAAYVFAALRPVSDQNPFPITSPTVLIFIPTFKRLHTHFLFLLRKHRQLTA